MSGAIFFDLDGTLVDTSRDILASLHYAAKSNGYVSARFARDLIGLPVRSIFAQTIHGISENEIDALETAFRQHHDSNLMMHWRPYVGLDALLKFLYGNRLDYYVITNRPRSGVLNLIRSGFSLITQDRFFCLSELGSDSKTSLLRSVLALKRLDPETSMLFGDHEGDILAGTSNSIVSYFCSYGFGAHMATVNSEKTYRSVTSLFEVRREIESFWRIF